MEFDLLKHTILFVVAGSRAYGLNNADSDLDCKGVAIPPSDYYLGYLKTFEQADKPSHMEGFSHLLSPELLRVVASSKLEGTVFELQKFCMLAADANPNIWDTLFGKDEHILLNTPRGQLLLDNRELFISARARYSFAGYACSQLKRIRGHRAWLLSPPKAPPVRADYGLPETTLIPSDQLAAAQATVRKVLDQWVPDFGEMPASEVVRIQGMIEDYLTSFSANLPEGLPQDLEGARGLAAARSIGASDNLIFVMQKEREYESAMIHWKQYQTWKASRNVARAELEAKYGYDTKHGAHLVRLLRMGREILTTGQVNVWRGGPNGDAGELLSIRRGEWSYDKLVEYSEAENAALTEIYKAKQYTIPNAPARNKIDALCIRLIESALTDTVLT